MTGIKCRGNRHQLLGVKVMTDVTPLHNHHHSTQRDFAVTSW